MDAYAILKIQRGASKEEIKKTFRALAKKYHSDKGGSVEKFREVVDAYKSIAEDRELNFITDLNDFVFGSTAAWFGYMGQWSSGHTQE